MGLLIDSTVFSHAERESIAPDELLGQLLKRFGDQPISMSVMTAGELFHGCWRAESPARRARREEYVESIIAIVQALPLTLPVLRIFGEIDARLRARGDAVPTSDLLIGCTALERGDALVTGNARHFKRLPGLKVHELRPSKR